MLVWSDFDIFVLQDRGWWIRVELEGISARLGAI